MPRPIWKGAISFGLVNISVSLYSATEEHDFRFHQVHNADGGRIRYKRVCSACGKEVEFADIVKGYELGDGRMITLDKEDFDNLPLSSSRSIEVMQFVPIEQVDPIHFQKTYYLEPTEAAVRPYVLLRDALVESERMAVTKVALRQRETLAMLRVHDDTIVLHSMLWPDEIRAANFSFLNEDVEVRRQELSMAISLIENMSSDFNPDEFTDDYRDAVQALLDAKAAGVEPEQLPAAEESDNVVDLMNALERSVEAAKQSGNGSSSRSSRAKSGSSSRSGSSSSRSSRSKSAASSSASSSSSDSGAKRRKKAANS